MLDMAAVESESFDAIYSSHNIEHLYPHQVVPALKEFYRVLKPEGFVVITCPDLKAVCKVVAEGNLNGAAYYYPGGEISAHEILYGLGPELNRGNLYMAHHCGFTLGTLFDRLADAGFMSYAGHEHDPFAMTVVARKPMVAQNENLAFAASVLGLSG
jgi:SAM-dependent methyltransferase